MYESTSIKLTSPSLSSPFPSDRVRFLNSDSPKSSSWADCGSSVGDGGTGGDSSDWAFEGNEDGESGFENMDMSGDEGDAADMDTDAEGEMGLRLDLADALK
jgi:hypothetical protein